MRQFLNKKELQIDRSLWKLCFFRSGLTWARRLHQCKYNLTLMSCGGSPAPPGGGFCNPYWGDTRCYHYRPLLCVNKSGIPRPPYDPLGHPFYNGWTGGIIRATRPMRGCMI